MDHPSALVMFAEIANLFKGKQIVMFLDYDGTLSPIVDDPDRAFMSEAMRDAVRDVSRYFPTVIVTGRCRHKVYSFVRLAELYYAGSHGMDIKGPKYTKDMKSVLFQPASEFHPIVEEVFWILTEKTKSIPGAKVENNKFCVSVHFRCVDGKRWVGLAKQIHAVVSGYPQLRVAHGRKVLEIRPTIKWDKGKALEFLLESLGFASSGDVLPVYIGDDQTGEDAFKVLREREDKGLVSSSPISPRIPTLLIPSGNHQRQAPVHTINNTNWTLIIGFRAPPSSLPFVLTLSLYIDLHTYIRTHFSSGSNHLHVYHG